MENNNTCHACRLPPECCQDCAYLAGTCCGGYPSHELPQEPERPVSFRAAETGPGWQFVGIGASSPVIAAAPRRLNTGRRTELRRLIRPILRQYDQDRDLNRGFPDCIEALLKLY